MTPPQPTPSNSTPEPALPTTTASATRPLPSAASILDSRTNLKDTRFLMAMLELEAKRSEGSPWLLVIRFDCLRHASVSLGQRAKGQLVSSLASRLGDHSATNGLTARTGETEFALLMADATEADCVQLGQQLAASLREPLSLGDSYIRQSVLPTPRIGLARWQASTVNSWEVLHQARLAATAVGGRSPVRLYSESLRTDLRQRMRFEAELSLALERQQLRLEYQPMIAIESGTVTGLEALLRWDHPEFGMVPPDEIIPIAEETGLIEGIGDWVLWESCRQMAAWRAEFPRAQDLTLNVNISARQLEQADLVDRVLKAMRSAGLPAGTLRLELTETMLVSNPEAAGRLAQLKRHGIEIQLDDFGSGYSSLSYLSRFPIDALKLDRSLIEGAQGDSKKTVILETVISLAKALGLSVAAEGIETLEQADRMRDLPCQTGQGFFFYRPLAGTAVEALLGRGLPRCDFVG